ncbi:iron-containing alcohol dehydrogenase [Frigidibacter albus]|uniref:Iron-containing alcohol dehydrogenase n=1 Tax=Frigidibacter albus TaxID=1465486 RepID=A0A6L8VEB3_9RHOB|nr:iron-containing alcohol dehydrogenase [Frigidibacter albus]MZQ88688.1 iron-containing alcohol dehydrogenase [Frigidibacter albus]NBE30503.1 iron-containing alcohol dehydrogenase [Frigidibacter albus]GGH49867.1 alcohol dehydrogenase [Frigidibacter albus]
MTAFSFLTATEIRFGRGTAAGAAEYVAQLGRNVLVVQGASGQRADPLILALQRLGVQVSVFACPREPDIALIEDGIRLARGAGVRAVVAIGGGAVIDCGKAIAALAPAPRPMLDHLEVVGRGLPLDAPPLPFVAIPTTAGTGAEVTKNAVIAVPGARRKVSLRDARMLPLLSIVDPSLTDGCPRGVTLASGLDAVTQVIEPYVSTKANRLTDALCRDAIPLGLRALARLMEGEDAGARDDLAWVSLCGGLALANAGLGAVHGLAGPIGGMAAAPHGAVCGALLPHVLAANMARAEGVAAARLAEVAGWIAGGLGGVPGNAAETLAVWSAAQGLPRLGAMGLAAGDVPEVAALAAGSSSMAGNPVVLDSGALIGVLRAAF